MKRLLTFIFASILAMASTASAEKHIIAYTDYVAWHAIAYMKSSGIMDKHATANGIEVEIVFVDDYTTSIDDYVAGKYSACAMTTMDALTIPAQAGLDSTVLTVTSSSNGNDGIVIVGGNSVSDLKGKTILTVDSPVTKHVITKALEKAGLTVADVVIKDVLEKDIVETFQAAAGNGENVAIAIWNPHLMKTRLVGGANMVFDSSMIPGEIIDSIVVRTDAPEALKKAITGAWYETMGIMSSQSKKSKDSIVVMAKSAKTTPKEFMRQLRTTSMFYDPAKAVAFVIDQKLKGVMNAVVKANNITVGIEFPDGTKTGENVKLRITEKYMKMAADGTL